MLRVTVRRAGRCRIEESSADPVWVGADEGCAVRLRGAGVRGRHAALHARRGWTVVRAVGSARVLVGGALIRAPVAVAPDESIAIGDHELGVVVAPPDPPSRRGASTAVGRLAVEIGDREVGVRRYLTTAGDWEVTVPDAPDAAWQAREMRADPDARPVADGVAASRSFRRTAAELLHAVTFGRLRIPPEAAVVFAARTMAQLERRGMPHGGLWPERIGLTPGGDVRVMPPGPAPQAADPLEDPFATEARRLGGEPRGEADRFALATLLARLDPERRRPDWLDGVLAAGHFGVLQRASRASLDATAAHLARVVAVLDAALERG